MTKFVELNTIGVSKDSQIRAAKVLEAVADSCGEAAPRGRDFFAWSYRLMAERWQQLREAVKSSGRFSLPEFSPAFCHFQGQDSVPQPGKTPHILSQKHRIRACTCSNKDFVVVLPSSFRVAEMPRRRGGLRKLSPGAQDPDTRREALWVEPSVRASEHAGSRRELQVVPEETVNDPLISHGGPIRHASLLVWPAVRAAMERARAAFGEDIREKKKRIIYL